MVVVGYFKSTLQLSDRDFGQGKLLRPKGRMNWSKCIAILQQEGDCS